MKLYSTKQHNLSASQFSDDKPVWIFGYGSLIYKVDFPFIKKQTGFILGWQRRFWMASQDHRGTPGKPGRVLTVVESSGSKCFGIAYLIEQEVLVDLDHREQNGYLRHNVNVLTNSGETISAITYIGDENAPVYRSADDHQSIAETIFRSSGPSGPNRDYLFDMTNALREHNEEDEHIFDIESRVNTLIQQKDD